MENKTLLLVVDIGNSNITFGIFENKKLISTFRMVSDINLSKEIYKKEVIKHTKNCDIKGCIVASVVKNLDIIIKDVIDEIYKIDSLVLNSKINYGIGLNADKKEIVGADRVANTYASYRQYSLPVIVVDLGTATTFDIVDKKGVFIGGIIMPGLEMQIQALNLKTSLLPKIDINQDSKKAIGDDTESSILAGVVRGTACAIDGLIKQCETELGEKATVVLTGGFSTRISKYMSQKFDYINPNLTLEGLRLLYELNTNP